MQQQAAELVAGLPEASVAWLASREAEALPDCSPVLEQSVSKVQDGRLSQSVQLLLSHGIAEGAFDQLLALHYEPEGDQTLTRAEHGGRRQSRYSKNSQIIRARLG
eukprot:COSAG06_NODE_275_length_18581_cov_31.316145_3_plen_106_part_00